MISSFSKNSVFKTQSGRFQIFPVWRTFSKIKALFSWRISVDGRPNRRNKAAFSWRISVDDRPSRRNKAVFSTFFRFEERLPKPVNALRSIMKKNSTDSAGIKQIKWSRLFFCNPCVLTESYQQERTQKLCSTTLISIYKYLWRKLLSKLSTWVWRRRRKGFLGIVLFSPGSPLQMHWYEPGNPLRFRGYERCFVELGRYAVRKREELTHFIIKLELLHCKISPQNKKKEKIWILACSGLHYYPV